MPIFMVRFEDSDTGHFAEECMSIVLLRDFIAFSLFKQTVIVKAIMKKILLLDDNLEILQIVEEVLTYEHFDVHSTVKAVEFLNIARQYRPDLIILDYRLADGDGGELCRGIKSTTDLRHIPVVIFCAYIGQNVDLVAYGCDAVMSKPFDLEDLLQTVQRLTGLNVDTDGEMV